MRIFFLAMMTLIFFAACEADRPVTNATPTETPSYPVDTAESAPVDIGKPYRFILSTHCGIDFAIDFDESFWKPIPEDRRAFRRGRLKGLRDADRGTMTLTSSNRAVYRSDNGPVIHYSRGSATRPDTPCF